MSFIRLSSSLSRFFSFKEWISRGLGSYIFYISSVKAVQLNMELNLLILKHPCPRPWEMSCFVVTALYFIIIISWNDLRIICFRFL